MGLEGVQLDPAHFEHLDVRRRTLDHRCLALAMASSVSLMACSAAATVVILLRSVDMVPLLLARRTLADAA